MAKQKIEQINYATVAKPHTPMYLMHKYWARKPHNVVSEYIENYTKEGEIVLDPFCGSGPTPIEAIKLGRKGVGLDLNPMAIFITRVTAIPVDISRVKSLFEEIKKECKEKIDKIYTTQCGKCKGPGIIHATHFQEETPIKLIYNCPKCGNQEKKPDSEDLELLKKIEKMKCPHWHPTQRLAYNGNGFKEGTHNLD